MAGKQKTERCWACVPLFLALSASALGMEADAYAKSQLHCVVMPSAIVDIASGVGGRVESIEVERGDSLMSVISRFVDRQDDSVLVTTADQRLLGVITIDDAMAVGGELPIVDGRARHPIAQPPFERGHGRCPVVGVDAVEAEQVERLNGRSSLVVRQQSIAHRGGEAIVA